MGAHEEGTPLLHQTFSVEFSNWLDSAVTLTFWLLATSSLKTSNWDGKTSHTYYLFPMLTNLFHIITISLISSGEICILVSCTQRKNTWTNSKKQQCDFREKRSPFCKLMSPKPLLQWVLLLDSNPLVEVWVQMTSVTPFRLPTSSQSLVILHSQPFPTRIENIIFFKSTHP